MTEESKVPQSPNSLSPNELALLSKCRWMDSDDFDLVATLADKLAMYSSEARIYRALSPYMHLIADKMSSEDRIEALSHGFIDNDIMSAEISFRTNIDQRAVSSALAYKFFFIEEPGRNITLDEIANEIEALTEAPTDETKGIEDVGFEDALAILNCEEDILWEIGIYIEP